MTTTSNLRSRRSAAQLRALTEVKREIQSTDNSGRRKYLREFTHAFRSYQRVLTAKDVEIALGQSDIVLIGDYHALAASQRFAAAMIELRAQPGDRPVVLGVETIFARDQHILDAWWRREIEEDELRRRIRFDLEWGYDWSPFYQLLVTAREHCDGIYALDCMPRHDLRKIGARDRHAAHKIAEIRTRHPKAAIMVLFGESHLAPSHLPKRLQDELSDERMITVLQNVDALYWRAAGEKPESIDAVQMADDIFCVFNSTPLEKYESYRLHLSRWGRADNEGLDLAPAIYNLIDSLAGFLGIDRYSAHNTTQPKFLVDMLPEIFTGEPDQPLERILDRFGTRPHQVEDALLKVDDHGCVYLPQINAFYVREFKMTYAAKECSRFLHHACRGLPQKGRAQPIGELSKVGKLEDALAHLGSRILSHKRPEDEVTTDSHSLGNALYDAYVQGRLSPNSIRRLFLVHIDQLGESEQLWSELESKFLTR